MPKPQLLRTWIEIDKKALFANAALFFKRVPRRTWLMAVVKSNAYGHGLTAVAKILSAMPEFGRRGTFGVDSIVEALRLRREGITNPILVLGYTLPERFAEAAEHGITLTASTFENLRALRRLKTRPAIHLKLDTGMYRQGFYPGDMPKVMRELKLGKITPEGIYTHFASAKDPGYPGYTLRQLGEFKTAVALLKRAGYRNIIAHCAASGGTLLFPESHMDMARVGMSLYGYFPSDEAKTHLEKSTRLRPVLSWKAVVSEVKAAPKGAYVGYDLSERLTRKTLIAVLPVGYWHGFDRGLSSRGEVLIRGIRRKVLGRVSMDMIVVDVTETRGSRVRPGDVAVLIGRQGGEEIMAGELALPLGTSPYEILTRLNPLIKRIVK